MNMILDRMHTISCRHFIHIKAEKKPREKKPREKKHRLAKYTTKPMKAQPPKPPKPAKPAKPPKSSKQKGAKDGGAAAQPSKRRAVTVPSTGPGEYVIHIIYKYAYMDG